MKKIIIFGGTGFIGISLAKHLEQKGFVPVLVARHKPADHVKFEFHEWDGVTVGAWKNCLTDAYSLVNLAGRTVDCIKTADNCDAILRSRVDATKAIGKAMLEVVNPPRIWVQMSTAHIYGDSTTQICTEDSTHGYGLAPFVAHAWEAAFDQSKPDNCRGVVLRTSFVIGKNGGALQSLKRIVKLGLGGKVGNGKQGISWIHEYDMNEIIHQSIINEQYKGVYISSAPNPISNAVFMQQLRKAMHVPIGLSAPVFVTKLGAQYIFKTDFELALYGRYVKPARLLREGFSFKYEHINQALDDLIRGISDK